ncbi:DEAD/DEAH box helicase [Halocynthiibacter sp. C4]|uniref:DEAD/DEAH box helicase n=1 Tax=Halocynthiibacter sp. C4 TaxID=2992758 RepID=UPI00237A163D|nr:DEAD/DEAH box helicase [Halocynthiibacter sp. C4]MDE0589977.1 DEAD/DEAH box helicase [Halocynthiibacter sp. C4]
MDFDMLGLTPRLVNKLEELGITEPTPIQTQAIPHAMNGRDVLGLAQTGTGKTAAFGLPLIHALSKDGGKPKPKHVAGLILAPTRELAKQIADSLEAFTKGSHLRVGLVVGGVGINRQIEFLRRGTHLLIATPGRLIDLLDRNAVSLSETRYLVLDEADQMLDLGFIHALRQIAPLLPKERQTLLFSATMPKQMQELSNSYLTNPVRVEVARSGQTAEKITQSVHFVAQPAKQSLLVELLAKHKDEMSLVFLRTKHGAEKLMKSLRAAGFAAGSIHGNKSQGQRDRAIKAFKEGEITVLVATDVAARGIDIQGVAYVYNYDLPNVPENYVHRIGRTARAGASGQAIAFCSSSEMGELRAIQKVIGNELDVASGRIWEVETAPNRGGRGGKRGGAGGGGKRRFGAGGGSNQGGKPRGQKRGAPKSGGQKQGAPKGGNRRRSGGGKRAAS